MNSLITAPDSASHAAAPAAPVVPPTANWRAFARDLLDNVDASIQGALRIDPDSCPHAIYLLVDGRAHINDMRSLVELDDTQSGDLLDHVYKLEAYLLGAQGMDEAPEAMKLLLTRPLELLDASSAKLDIAKLPAKPEAEASTAKPAPANRTSGEKKSAALFDRLRNLSNVIATLGQDIEYAESDGDIDAQSNRAGAIRELAGLMAFLSVTGLEAVHENPMWGTAQDQLLGLDFTMMGAAA